MGWSPGRSCEERRRTHGVSSGHYYTCGILIECRCLKKGSLCRTTASTDMNASSSRSHAIFSIILRQTVPEDPTNPSLSQSMNLSSKLNFVDLAGSERVSNSCLYLYSTQDLTAETYKRYWGSSERRHIHKQWTTRPWQCYKCSWR